MAGSARVKGRKGEAGKRCSMVPWGLMPGRVKLKMTYLNLYIFSVRKKFCMRNQSGSFPETKKGWQLNHVSGWVPTGMEAS